MIASFKSIQMQFNNIHIQYFRGFKELQLDDFKQINLLVGKNNAGKSSVLEALFLLCGASNPRLVFTIDSHRDIFGIFTDILKSTLGLEKANHYLKMIYFELNEKQKIHLKADLGTEKRHIEISPTYSKQNKSSQESHSEWLNGYQFDYTQTPIGNKGKTYISAVSIEGLNIEEQKTDTFYQEKLLGILLNPRNMNEVAYANLLNDFILSKEISSIVAVLQSVDSRIQHIVMDSNAVIYCDTGLARMIPLSIMGDGIKRILSIVLRMAQCKNGVMLIDEIDNGFHYSSAFNLWKAVFSASEKYHVQVFATTHSDECVRAYEAAYKSVFQPDTDNIRLYRIENKEDGSHKSVKMDAETLGKMLEMNWEYR
jgi:AAA15 family ATPase/GTPase